MAHHVTHKSEEPVSSHHILSFSTPTPARVAELESLDGVDGIIGRSPVLLDVLERVRRVAPTDMPVLITGETGTGKELLARAIHRRSRRASKPLVAVNLAALPEPLIAAELFGHERGAFTGAERLRFGRFEAADRGTLFLDEVGELSADMQVMLLRVLQGGEFERLGSGATRRVDVRLVAATNSDLEQAMQEGRFRQDLFYRLSVFPIHLPPLRERPDDIPALAEFFLHRAATLLGRRFTGIEPGLLRRLQQYRWPGNIRQLQNVIEQTAVLCDDEQLQMPPAGNATPAAAVREGDALQTMFAEAPSLEELKKRYITHLLSTTRGNMVRAAAILGVDRRTLYRMVARYRLRAPALRDRSADAPDALAHRTCG
jgi:transcriptional regulator with GAF, ATPase, and Fis domain